MHSVVQKKVSSRSIWRSSKKARELSAVSIWQAAGRRPSVRGHFLCSRCSCCSWSRSCRRAVGGGESRGAGGAVTRHSGGGDTGTQYTPTTHRRGLFSCGLASLLASVLLTDKQHNMFLLWPLSLGQMPPHTADTGVLGTWGIYSSELPKTNVSKCKKNEKK